MYQRGNPYIGPRPFTEQEFFFGRERERHQLFNRLIADRIVLLYSPSGAGKTSLVRANLIPMLRAKGWFIWPMARLNQSPPHQILDRYPDVNRYVVSVQLCLEESLEPGSHLTLEEVVGLSLKDYLENYFARHVTSNTADPYGGEVLIIDQFEEILTLDPIDLELKRAFFTQLGEALQTPDRWALFMLREDYLAALEPFTQFFPTRLKNTFRLDRLSRAAALEAIQGPARRSGVVFSDEAAHMFLDDLSKVVVEQQDGTLAEVPGAHIEPVQLQVASRRLWENLPAGVTEITPDHVRAVGDAGDALAEFYASGVAKVALETGYPESHIRTWFQSELITPALTRGVVFRGQDTSGGLDNIAVDRLVDLYLVRQEHRRGEIWLELPQDRLIEPVLADNEAWFQAHGSPTSFQEPNWLRGISRERLLILLAVETVVTIVAVILAIIGWTSN